MAEHNTVNNQYLLLKRLGRGGIGTVYVAEDLLRGRRKVAFKVIRPQAQTAGTIRHTQHEFELLTRLVHPNIARVFEFGNVEQGGAFEQDGIRDEIEGGHFVTQEYCVGFDLLTAARCLSGCACGHAVHVIADYDDLCEALVQVCRALDYIHSLGIIHYDIKPTNIIVGRSDSEQDHISTIHSPRASVVAKLVDFGVAGGRIESPREMGISGTVEYMAPELLAGRQADTRADIYSLGATLFHVTTGQLPFTATTLPALIKQRLEQEPPAPREINSLLPEPLEVIIKKMMARDPADRYQKVAEIIEALGTVTGKDHMAPTGETARCYLTAGKFVGRRDELERMLAMAEELRNGTLSTPVLLVCGQSGVGKSRLVREFCYRTLLRGIEVFEARCYAAMEKILDEFLGAAAQIVSRASRSSEILAKRYQELLRLVSVSPGVVQQASFPWDEEDPGMRLTGALSEFLREASEICPFVFVLEDLHLADDALLKFVETVAQRLMPGIGSTATDSLPRGRTTILLCATYRTEAARSALFAGVLKRLKTIGGIAELELTNLRHEEAEDLIASMVSTEQLGQLTQKVITVTGGNPLFITEVMGSLVEKGMIRYTGQGWQVVSATVEAIKLPPAVTRVILERFLQLPPAHRSVVRLMAAIGRPVSAFLLSQVAGQDSAPLMELLDELVLRAMVARERSEGKFQYYELAHPALGEIVRGRLHEAEKRELHAGIAHVIERINADNLDEKVEELAFHFSRAADREKTVHYCMRAAEAASRRGSIEVAKNYCEQVLQSIPSDDKKNRPHALQRIAALYRMAGQFDRAWQRLQEAVRLVEEDDYSLQGALSCSISRICQEKGQLKQAGQWARRAVKSLKRVDAPVDLAMSYDALASATFLQGQPDRAKLLMTAAVRLLEPLGATNELGLIYGKFGTLLLLMGDHADALEYFQRAVKLHEQVGDSAQLLVAKVWCSISWAQVGDIGTAIEELEEAAHTCERIGAIPEMVTVQINLAELYSDTGQLDKAAQLVRQAINSNRQLGRTRSLGHGMFLYGEILMYQARYSEALKCLETSMQILEQIGARYAIAFAYVNYALVNLAMERLSQAAAYVEKALHASAAGGVFAVGLVERCAALVALRQGDLDAAEQWARRALERGTHMHDRHGIPHAQLILAKVHFQRGNRTEAGRLCVEAVENASRANIRKCRLEARLLQGKLEYLAGNIGKAMEILESLGKDITETPFRELLWQLHLAMAHCYLSQDREDDAFTHLIVANAVLEDIAASVPEEMRGSFMSCPLRREVKEQHDRIEQKKKATAGRPALVAALPERISMESKTAGPKSAKAIDKLLEVNRLLASEAQLEKLLALVLDSAIELCRAERGFVVLVENSQQKFMVARDAGKQSIVWPESKVSHNIVEKVVSGGVPLVTVSAQDDPCLKLYDSVTQLRLLSVVCVPLSFRGKFLGAVYLDNSLMRGAFSQEELWLLQRFAEQAAIAVENTELSRRVITDPLTGLYHHNYFSGKLDEELSRATRFSREFCLMLIDIDRFKLINDVHGHEVGNLALVEAAGMLRRTLRASDAAARVGPELSLIGRYGGDEFEILLVESGKRAGVMTAERLRSEFADNPLVVSSPCSDTILRLNLTVSVGMVSYPEDASSMKGLLEKADEMLYNAKRKGRNQVSCFETPAQQVVAPAPPTSPHLELLDRDRMALLEMLSKLLQAGPDISRLLDLVISVILDVTHADRGFVVLVEDKGKYSFISARHISYVEIDSPEFAVSHSIIREVVTTGKGIVVENAMEHPQFGEQQSVTGLQLKSVLSAPIRSRQNVIGAVYLDNQSATRFTQADLALLETFAGMIAGPIENSILYRKQQQEIDAIKKRCEMLQAAVSTKYSYDKIVGRSAAMRNLFGLLDKVIDSDVTVIIEGESGTGKELVARAIHYNGRRKNMPFAAVNCAAMSESLLEAELFGYVKGAFTGATADRTGLFEEATGGTILLDEIGDMSPKMQAELLRVLQEAEIRPLGGQGCRKVDVRILCASNRNLQELVEQKKLRSDLYYRLNVVRLHVPPLQHRKEDIPLLVEHFLKELAEGEKPKRCAPEVVDVLIRCNWPGNVRELKNCIERAVVLCDSDLITAKHIVLEKTFAEPAEKPQQQTLVRQQALSAVSVRLTEAQKNVLQHVRERGPVSSRECAQLLNISIATAKRLLADLVAKEMLESVGKGRACFYQLSSKGAGMAF